MLLSPFHIQGHETWEKLSVLPKIKQRKEQSQKLELGLSNTNTHALDSGTRLPAKEKKGRATTGGLLPEWTCLKSPQEKY